MAQVTIYTTPTCSFCKMTKTFFQEHNVQYTEKDVSADLVAQEEMIKKSGQLGVPVIDIDGQIIVGFEKNALAHALNIH